MSKKAVSEKDLETRNYLHELRKSNRKRFKRIGAKLKSKGFTTTEGMHELLVAHDDESQAYAFTDAQLAQIRKIISLRGLFVIRSILSTNLYSLFCNIIPLNVHFLFI